MNDFDVEVLIGRKKILNFLKEKSELTGDSIYQTSSVLLVNIESTSSYDYLKLNVLVFFKFSFDSEGVIIIPLSRSLASGVYSLYGDGYGVPYCGILSDFSYGRKHILKCIGWLKLNYKNNTFQFNRIISNSKLDCYLFDNEIQVCSEEAVSVKNIISYESYFNGLSKKSRQNYRTAINRIKRDSLDYNVRYLTGLEIMRYSSELQRIYLRRLLKYSGFKFIYKFILHKFFDKYLTIYSRLNAAMVVVIEINDQIAAFMVVVRDGRNILVPKLAIDARFSFYSPGIVMINQYIRDEIATRDECLNLDFMQGSESYKYQVGGTEHYLNNYVLFRS